MSDQLDLFNDGRVRNSDPPTSHNAAALIDAPKLQGQCLAAVKASRHYGLTTHEIADQTGIEWQSVTPRMVQLEEKGLVRRWGERKPPGRRVPCIVWVAT